MKTKFITMIAFCVVAFLTEAQASIGIKGGLYDRAIFGIGYEQGFLKINKHDFPYEDENAYNSNLKSINRLSFLNKQ